MREIGRGARLGVLVVTLFIAGATPTTAAADDGKQAMMDLNDQGFAAFSDGRFAEAARTFARAYDAYPDPVCMKNEAIAWYKAGAWAKAISAANRFLSKKGTQPSDRKEAVAVLGNAKVELAGEALDSGSLTMAEQLLDEVGRLDVDSQVRDQVSALRVELARAEKKRAAPHDEATRGHAEKAEDDVGETSRARPDGPVTSGAPAPDVVEEVPPPKGHGAPIVVACVGGAVLLGTVIYHLVAFGWQAQFLDMTRIGGDPDRFETLRARVDTARWAVPALYAVGGVIAGVGISWAVFASQSEVPTATRAPHVGLCFVLNW